MTNIWKEENSVMYILTVVDQSSLSLPFCFGTVQVEDFCNTGGSAMGYKKGKTKWHLFHTFASQHLFR